MRPCAARGPRGGPPRIRARAAPRSRPGDTFRTTVPRSLGPRLRGRAVRESAPQVHDQPPAMVDGARRADVAMALEVLRKGVAHRRESRLAGTVDLDRHARLL